jgi:hypothetical protein
MEGAQSTLVVILSSALAVFLLLAIVATVKLIQILTHLNKIAEKAEHIADSAESIGEFFKQGAQSMSVARLLGNIYEHVFKKSNERKSK